MDPITSLLADFAFGLALMAMVFILYVIGTYHAPHAQYLSSTRDVMT